MQDVDQIAATSFEGTHFLSDFLSVVVSQSFLFCVKVGHLEQFFQIFPHNVVFIEKGAQHLTF